MVPKKSKSKRQSLSDKFKIERRCKEHNRKIRKQGRKDGTINGVQKLKKDPGIPNLWPFKEGFIRQMEAKKKHELEQKEREKERRKQIKAQGLSSLVQDAESRGQEYEKQEEIIKGDMIGGNKAQNTWHETQGTKH